MKIDSKFKGKISEYSRYSSRLEREEDGAGEMRVRGERDPADFYRGSRRAAFETGKKEGKREIIERPRATIDANKALDRTNGRAGERAGGRAHALGRNASGNQSSRSR